LFSCARWINWWSDKNAEQKHNVVFFILSALMLVSPVPVGVALKAVGGNPASGVTVISGLGGVFVGACLWCLANRSKSTVKSFSGFFVALVLFAWALLVFTGWSDWLYT
jgi:hypothetical protein